MAVSWTDGVRTGLDDPAGSARANVPGNVPRTAAIIVARSVVRPNSEVVAG